MVVKITSNIPYLQQLNGEHRVVEKTTVKAFLECLGIKWDEDALVVLNGKISTGQEKLKENDRIQLLIPLAGG
ncbi:MoaD/ThiS family protein [Tepidibacillus infernus]|uniref:Thiamine biosynthesis protein ThiS n=1 Tax=Tepidibacillus decaturensis TaxID=1413211 RepID=A0A135L0Z6_9BACI|nr:MoaD/ThiS family protein [Tepidibacillus decaturensis]KXG42583.1 hypothetical protein U473_14040 [Tepidibacillus decaturensis]